MRLAVHSSGVYAIHNLWNDAPNEPGFSRCRKPKRGRSVLSRLQARVRQQISRARLHELRYGFLNVIRTEDESQT